MSRRAREHLAFGLFFPPLAYLVFMGWERFMACGCRGSAWLEVLLPALGMSAALLIWPAPAHRA